jgi:hypothetical protein
MSCFLLITNYKQTTSRPNIERRRLCLQTLSCFGIMHFGSTSSTPEMATLGLADTAKNDPQWPPA